MQQALELTGPWGALVLAVPMLILLAVMMRGTRAKRRGERGTRPGVGAPAQEPSAQEAGSEVAAAEEASAQAALLARRVAEAEAQGAEDQLADLYLVLAKQHAKLGDAKSAADYLLRSIRISVRKGLSVQHAEARLELGDLARQAGDLTTACEHWQIARGLFHEIGKAADLKSVESRMKSHGCPTDWVLNDF